MISFGILFSGIGGFDLGFEQANMKCEWQVEKDETCRKVLTRHWPNVEKFEDVKDVGKNNLRPVDVICGGFPCQDLSIAGRRQGLAGERSGLWFEFARIIGELEPRFVVIENVPGLLYSKGGKDFAVILLGLVKLGYGVSWRILDAQYFGVAQRRRRVFIVGSLGGLEQSDNKGSIQNRTRLSGLSARVLFESAGVSWDSPTRSKSGQGIAKIFAATLRSGGNGKRGYTFDAEQGLTTPGEHIVAMPLLAKGNSSHDESLETYVSSNKCGVRRLTPRECERLQGFPDDFTAWGANGKKISNSARYKMLGNAVAVPCARWIGYRIVNFYE